MQRANLLRATILVLVLADTDLASPCPPSGVEGEPPIVSGKMEALVQEEESTLHTALAGPRHRPHVPEWDIGIGFLRFELRVDHPPRLRWTSPLRTLRILSEPRTDAPVVAEARGGLNGLKIRAVEAGLQNGTLEIGYEETALPVLETGPEDQWVHVSFGFDEQGAVRTGWAELGGTDALDVQLISWSDWLTARSSLYFADPEAVAFFRQRDGELLELPLAPTEGTLRHDYALYPIRAVGPWMEVEVVSPSDKCTRPDSPTRATAWIRFLDDTGRPEVWYFTRGC